MDSHAQEQLLKDPAVQAALLKAGTAQLSDPAVQAQIVATCKDKFPHYADVVAEHAKSWATDPAVQAKAKEYSSMALAYAAGAGGQIMHYIEQGPAGVRVLAFVASTISLVMAVMTLINIFSMFSHVMGYLTAIFQIIFALTSMLFEANPAWITKAEKYTLGKIPINRYHDMLIEDAKFLSKNGGRGLFYMFQGVLWLDLTSSLTEVFSILTGVFLIFIGFFYMFQGVLWLDLTSSLTEVFSILTGVFLIFIGVLHVLIHFKVMPQTVAEKMRESWDKVASNQKDYSAPELEAGAIGSSDARDLSYRV